MHEPSMHIYYLHSTPITVLLFHVPLAKSPALRWRSKLVCCKNPDNSRRLCWSTPEDLPTGHFLYSDEPEGERDANNEVFPWDPGMVSSEWVLAALGINH